MGGLEKNHSSVRIEVENAKVVRDLILSFYFLKLNTLFRSTKKKTINPVKVGGIIVNYTKNKYDYERYICTHKYKLMKKWYETFGQSLN